MERLQAWDAKTQRREKDRFKVGRKKRLLHELRLARQMIMLVSVILLTENIKKWERRRRVHRCDFLELMVPVPRATERAGSWSLVAGEPVCEQAGWSLHSHDDHSACQVFIERNRPEVVFIMPDPVVWGGVPQAKWNDFC